MYGNWFRLKPADMRMILTAGVAAGFGAVFGTPLTGAIFALEVLTIGKIKYNALLPALMAGIVGDLAVSAWHVSHNHYHIDLVPEQHYPFSEYLHINPILLAKVIVSSVVFGIASFLFSTAVNEVKAFTQALFKRKWMIPVIGGLTIILLTFMLGKPDYLSLGVEAEYPGAVTISSAFHTGGSDTWSWFWKMLYTGITLGTGFKGGEVTPLFYVGATLGNTLSSLLDAPASLFAALGFIAVFAGATNTPLACTLMGIELFGGEYALFFAVACFTSYICSGHSGIYHAQRISVPKLLGDEFKSDHSVSDAVKRRGYLHEKFKKY
jgi:H+/Cl- antiporter ClcA